MVSSSEIKRRIRHPQVKRRTCGWTDGLGKVRNEEARARTNIRPGIYSNLRKDVATTGAGGQTFKKSKKEEPRLATSMIHPV